MKLIGKPNFPKPQKILLIQLRRIGDIILCTPALRALAKHFPEAQIDFAVEHIGYEALLGNPHLKNLLIAPESKQKGGREFVKKIRREKYDWTIDFMSSPRSSQFAFASGAKIRVGLDRFGRRWPFTHRLMEEESDRDLYAVDLRLSILKQLGVANAGRELEVFSDSILAEETARAKKLVTGLPKPIVALAVGSGNAAKRYPTELSAQVISDLLKQNLSIVITAGPHEKEFADDIISRLNQTVPVLENAGVAALAALYRNCSLYIGPDSAPKHTAVACGLPTVTIFGPGNPANWNPISDKNILLAPDCEFRPNCDEKICSLRHDLKKISPQSIVNAAMKMIK